MGRSFIKLVVGLGNPGPKYQGTRHNVGFEVLDRLVALAEPAGPPAQFVKEGALFVTPPSLSASSTLEGTDDVGALDNALVARVQFARTPNAPALLLKPQTFMNLSGEAVKPIVGWAELDPEDVLVVYDDMDLPLGALRIRPHGSAGGQKGMASIIQHLETDRIPRLRVGIGRPETDAARHVLSVFDSSEREQIDLSVREAAEAIEHWLQGNSTEDCMTRFHSRWNRGPEGPA